MNFFAELKRRNVYKVAIAYAVVAWLLIQAASIFLPAFDAPPWVMKIFIIVIIFGFPVALIFSWAFEITPEGIKLESEIASNKSITAPTVRTLARAPSRDREETRSDAHPGGKRPEGQRSGPSERAADQCSNRRASLG